MKIFDWLAASAVEDPEMPAKKIESTTLTCARPPGKVTDQVARQAHEPRRDAADVHQVRRQQEERHRQQDEGVVRVEGFLDEVLRREAILDEEDRQAREAERESHRHAQREQREETPKRMRLAVPGSRTVAPVMPRFPGSFPAPISAALCRRRCAGRPTSVRRGTASRSRRRAARANGCTRAAARRVRRCGSTRSA